MNRLSSLLPVAALLVVAGCKPEAEPAEAKPVSAAEAGPAGNALAASMEESASSYSPAGPSAFGGAATCTVTAEENGDVDADGVLDNSSVVISDCETEERNGVVNASYSVVDDLVESGAATLPFNFTLTGHWDVSANGGPGAEDHVGSIIVDRSISGNQSASSFGGSDSGSVSASLSGPNASISSDEAYDWDASYTQTGAIFGDGQLAISGSWNVELVYEEGENSASVFANSTVMATGDGLELSSACPTHVVGGSLAATYAANDGENDFDATLTVTWSGCGASTTTYTQTAGTPAS